MSTAQSTRATTSESSDWGSCQVVGMVHGPIDDVIHDAHRQERNNHVDHEVHGVDVHLEWYFICDLSLDIFKARFSFSSFNPTFISELVYLMA